MIVYRSEQMKTDLKKFKDNKDSDMKDFILYNNYCRKGWKNL